MTNKGTMSEDEPPHSPIPFRTPEESLLHYSRLGDHANAEELLKSWSEDKVSLNINCKGEQKSNHGWTPLHLACYFGHQAVVELLIKYGADVNVVNDTGDTPLHKAAYTGREELVLLLLSSNANVFLKNSLNQTAYDITENNDIKELLKAAEEVDIGRKNMLLLHASREGDVEVIEDLLKSDTPPDINYVDSLGNSALHCAAYRGRKEVAVLLLQNGINTSIKNIRGQCAIDMAVNAPMKQLLSVQPVKHFQKTAARFEGCLLRKSRFLGWKEVWTVLDKGVMSFFNSRADSTTGTKRKGYKYLDGAKVDLDCNDATAFTVTYSDNTRQKFSVPSAQQHQVDCLKWKNALVEHVEFSSYYLKQGFSDSDTEDGDNDIIPIGTMQDKLQTAQAYVQLLENRVKSFGSTLREVDDVKNKNFSSSQAKWATLYNSAENLVELANTVCSSLSHCLTVFEQQEELRQLQFREQQEHCRVLQDALHALAQEHHELEKSFVNPFHSSPNSPHYEDTDCDEFFDANEGEATLTEQSDILDVFSGSYATLPGSPEVPEAFSSFSSIFASENSPPKSKYGRSVLPVRQYSRNDFSVWSILKQCIGKELSKITMPIVFNEPLSLLQRFAENLEYYSLLEKADNMKDPIERLEYVAAFAVASISSNWERLGKPFNPMLGETYELCQDEGVSILTEQVSHHPPVSAFHMESANFVFSGSIHPRLKLWARSVEIKPEGTVILKLKKHDETYTWTGVTCCVHNIIVGKLWMEQCGRMEITCHTNGVFAEINFKPAGWSSKDLNRVEGFLFNSDNRKERFIHGKWCSYLESFGMQYYDDYLEGKDNFLSTSDLEAKELSGSDVSIVHRKCVIFGKHYRREVDVPVTFLWGVNPRPDNSFNYYNFTYFAMALNELHPEMKNVLAPTDSRLRPDIRKLEEGDIDGAASEKHRLEEKQREARKVRRRDKSTWEPVWFESTPHPYAEEETWRYKGGYWDRNFTRCPDIF